MKKGIVRMRKSVLLTLLVLGLSIVMVSVGRVSPIPTITQANPVTTVYLDPPTINGTVIGQEFTVNLTIRDAHNIYAWNAGMIFNATVLNCTGFFEGEFLEENAGPEGTGWLPGVINNTEGVIKTHGCTLLEDYWATGDGRLAYGTFKVKALGVSDIHLSNVKVLDYPDLNLVPVNIIDVYTVVLDTTPHNVVIVSNSTDTVGGVRSGLYGHAFSVALKELSFNVTGPHPGFSNVTIPKALLPPPEPPRVWAVIEDGKALNLEKITKSENGTHTSIYFTYSEGLHVDQITTRFMPSTISIALSEDSLPLGESVTISGNVTGADDEVRASVDVTIQNRTSGATEWDTLATIETDQNGEYTYTWEPGTTGTYEIMASWEGDEKTLRKDSDVLTLKVKGKPGIPLVLVAIIVVAIIVIVAIVVYFAKIRKP